MMVMTKNTKGQKISTYLQELFVITIIYLQHIKKLIRSINRSEIDKYHFE